MHLYFWMEILSLFHTIMKLNMVSLVRIVIFIIAAFSGITASYADGSKDMYPRYPKPVKGNRAFMISRTARDNNVLFNSGAHYVYARVGETIAVASSAQGIGAGRIILTAPNDSVYRTVEAGKDGNAIGRIQAKTGYTTREAELAGPRVGYDAFEREVLPGQEGIWKIEFMPTRAEDNDNNA